MVEVAASIAAAASTALPPFWKIIAPAVAASGLPVIAIQRWPWSGGFAVRCAGSGAISIATPASARRRDASGRGRTDIGPPHSEAPLDGAARRGSHTGDTLP